KPPLGVLLYSIHLLYTYFYTISLHDALPIYVDYRIDLNNALEDYEHHYEEGDDIRYLLAENTPFVPAYSLPYTIQDGEQKECFQDRKSTRLNSSHVSTSYAVFCL